jgi:G:T/U-mismatch repair DNA glycosylase
MRAFCSGCFALLLGILVATRLIHAAAVPPDTWAFEPARDRFDPASLLDLRGLNEAVAGQSGFVRVDGKGGFLRGDGQPLRFWAVNTALASREPVQRPPLWGDRVQDVEHHARFLAKRGVNLVRVLRQISPDLESKPDAALTDIDAAERDAIWRTVAAMRRQGIYTMLSAYWAVPMKFAQAWGVRGGPDQSALGLLFFDEQLEAAYRSWLRQLLTEKNPYTGIALAQDPALAILQLQNEDSLLFWTVDVIKGPQREALEKRFADFARAKHGSVVAAQAAWRGHGVLDDSPMQGRLSLRPMWELTQPVQGTGPARRLADQTEFYARTMHDFNRRTIEFLRRELGVRALVNAGNWKTADAARLGDAERWSYMPGEVDAVNHYFSGVHQGESEGWAIVAGDRFTDESALLSPNLLPINLRQTRGRPIMVTESAWVPPNSHGAEGPFLVAAYSSLTGVAGFHWFSIGEDEWATPRSANGYLPSLTKWTFGTPETLGSFPAAALAYRRGDIRRGDPVLVHERPIDSLWQRDPVMLPEQDGFDPNRDAADRQRRAAGQVGAIPPEAFLVGPVEVAFGTAKERIDTPDLARWIDPRRVRANTGELLLDHQRGYATIDTPLTQGVAAHFANAREQHQLSVLGLRSDDAFGALMAVSLDGLPLARSTRILLQYATRSWPSGWQDKPATLQLKSGGTIPGKEVVSFGHAPWRVAQPRLDVSVRNPGLRRATALDMNGMPVAEVPLQRQADAVSLRFPPGVMYVVLRANPGGTP